MSAKASNREYQVISTDDHVVEPPNVWQSRLPAHLRDSGPKMVSTGEADVWEIAGERYPISGLAAMAGRSFEDYTPKAIRLEDMRPGCYDSVARLEDMDEDGVDAQVLFGTIAGLAGGTFIDLASKHAELALECIIAYNDWLASEWCAKDPGRLVPQAILPLWDPGASAEEVERAASIGHRGILIPAIPQAFGLPPLADDAYTPVLDACSNTGLPVALHIGGSIARKQAAELAGGLTPGSGVPGETIVAITPLANFSVFANLIFSGIPERHPNVDFVSVESGIGWVPYFLERMDWTYTRHRFWTKSTLKDLPSNYFRRQMYATFLVDDTGIDALDAIGSKNVMWESDYPHTDTTWPNSKQIIEEHLGHLDAGVRHQVLAGNAQRVYGL